MGSKLTTPSAGVAQSTSDASTGMHYHSQQRHHHYHRQQINTPSRAMTVAAGMNENIGNASLSSDITVSTADVRNNSVSKSASRRHSVSVVNGEDTMSSSSSSTSNNETQLVLEAERRRHFATSLYAEDQTGLRQGGNTPLVVAADRGATAGPLTLSGLSHYRSNQRRLRALIAAHSLPISIFPMSFDLKCPICRHRVPSDDIELHFAICLTKPRIDYNEETLAGCKGECIICFEDMLDGQTIARLPCLCIYHKTCIESWFDVRRSCPAHPPDDDTEIGK